MAIGRHLQFPVKRFWGDTKNRKNILLVHVNVGENRSFVAELLHFYKSNMAVGSHLGFP
jgi:hypothetical protein